MAASISRRGLSVWASDDAITEYQVDLMVTFIIDDELTRDGCC